MQDKCLIIYYPDAVFVSRFCAYLEKKLSLPLRCRGFWEPEAFLKALDTGEGDLILAPPDMRLPEGAGPRLVFTESAEALSSEELPLYRSMDRQIKTILARLDFSAPKEGDSDCRIIGFYSPVHGAGQSVSAILMGMVLAEKSPTLLVNLERFSGLGQLLPQGEGSLSDLLYYARVRQDLQSLGPETAQYFGPLAFIPPVREAGDLEEAGSETLSFLLEELKHCGLYRYILVDVGEGAGPVLPLLSLCHSIYVPVREDDLALAKLAEWEDYLAEQGAGVIKSRLKTFRLPTPGPEEMTEYRELRHMAWGRTIRALAEGEK